MPNVMPFAIHHVMNEAIEVSDDAMTARGRWYLLQTATLGETNEAVWLAARYDDALVFEDGVWRFAEVKLKSRFYTTHRAGWADIPHLLQEEDE